MKPQKQKKVKDLQVTWKSGGKPESLEAHSEDSELGQLAKDLDKLKEVLNRRQFTIENSAAQIRSQRKVLASLRQTSNRDQLLQFVTDLEDANAKIVDNLEGQLLNLQDAFRQVDKVMYQLSLERGDWERRTQELVRDRVNEEKTKAETQVASLKELNDTLKKEIRVIDRPALEAKLQEAQTEVSRLQRELADQKQAWSRRANETTVFTNTLQGKDLEITRLNDEIEGLQRIIKAQNEDHREHTEALEHQLSALNEQIVSGKEAEEAKMTQVERFKDQEIAVMRRELDRMRQELEQANRNAQRQEDILHVQIGGLKHELAVLEDRNKAILEGEQTHKSVLQQSYYDKEEIWTQEKQKLLDDLDQKEKHRLKQKNEWAEIYSQLKQEISDQKKRLSEMSLENDKLLKQLERSHHDTIDTEISLKAQNENYKAKLRDREIENGSLWEVVQELQRTHQSRGKIDIRDLQTSLVLKNLDEKARKKMR